MKPILPGTGARRKGRRWPMVIALGLVASACASDPYVESVHLTAEERESEQPNAAAAAALMRVAMATRGAGDYASAINVLQRAHKLAPRNMPILLALGESLAAVGAYNEAREIMAKALGIAPTDTSALRGLANALVALGEPALALGHYRAAIELRPEAASYGGLGVALDTLGRPEEAEKAYRGGLALEPRNAGLMGNLGLSLALRGRADDAIGLLAGEIREGRSSARLRQNLALVYGLAGRPRDARTLLLIDLDPATVVNNLAYYEMLRSLPAERRREAVLGARTIVAGDTHAAALLAPAAPVRQEPDKGPSLPRAPASAPAAPALAAGDNGAD